MRRFLISLLAASMLVPAAASAQDGGFGRGDRERPERSEQSDSDDRPQRAERPARTERSERPDGAERTQRSERAERQPRIERSIERGEPAERTERVERVRRIEPGDDSLLGGLRASARRQQDDTNVEVRPDRPRDRDRDGWRRRVVESGGRVEREGSDGWRDRVVDNPVRVDRDGDGRRDWGSRDRDDRRDWRRDRDGRRDWSRDWRRDDRYNWHSYRSRYGSLFRLGRYHDPYRYGYRRFSIGFNLWPSYYGSSFWLRDPWHYRLPPAYGPYRWVRYYDDALLVNIYTGQVVDVVYNVFW